MRKKRILSDSNNKTIAEMANKFGQKLLNRVHSNKLIFDNLTNFINDARNNYIRLAQGIVAESADNSKLYTDFKAIFKELDYVVPDRHAEKEVKDIMKTFGVENARGIEGLRDGRV